jgi:hypothetical protein
MRWDGIMDGPVRIHHAFAMSVHLSSCTKGAELRDVAQLAPMSQWDQQVHADKKYCLAALWHVLNAKIPLLGCSFSRAT